MFEVATNNNLSLVSEWEVWLRTHRYAPRTFYGYSRILTRFLQAYPQLPIEKFTPEHIERWLDGRRLSNSAYCTQLDTLRAFFRWLRRHKRLLRSNPCSGVDKPLIRRKASPMATPQQFRALCGTARRLGELVALHLMFYSGLRINELCHVKVGDVDLDRRLVRVREGKGTGRSGPRERWTVLHLGSAAVVKLYLWRAVKLHPDLWLLGRGTKPLSCQSVRAWFNRNRMSAGLPEDLTPHALRHGFLHMLKVNGVSLEIAANLAGHANLETTRRVYAQLSPEEMRKVYDRAMETALV